MQLAVIQRYRQNPLIARMLRRQSKYSIAWLLVVILSLYTLVGSLFFKNETTVNFFVAVGWLTLFVNPIYAALTAATVTESAIRAQSYEMLFITPLTNAELIDAYLVSALYRLRVPILWMLSLMPALVIRMVDFAFQDYTYCARFRPNCVPPSSDIVAQWFAVHLTSMVIAFGITLLAIVLATALALWWRHRFAAFFATCIVLAGMAFSIFAVQMPLSDLFPARRLLLYVPSTVLIFSAIAVLLSVMRRTLRPRP